MISWVWIKVDDDDDDDVVLSLLFICNTRLFAIADHYTVFVWEWSTAQLVVYHLLCSVFWFLFFFFFLTWEQKLIPQIFFSVSLIISTQIHMSFLCIDSFVCSVFEHFFKQVKLPSFCMERISQCSFNLLSLTTILPWLLL